MTHEELYKQNGQTLERSFDGQSFWNGHPIHSGMFTSNNPYYIQLQNALGNEDKDALYAKAVEWQSNYYNTLEEREYNSPEARIARDKVAGINSDIVGATTGGTSSSSPAGSSIAPPQTDVQYSSVSSRTGRILDSINSACNVVSTVASFGTAAIGAIRDIKTMPSQVSLAETQAYIADQTIDSVVESSNLSAIQSRLALVNQLSSFFTPESTSDDFTNVLSTLGLSKEVIPDFEKAIREYHSNPAYKANYEENISRALDGSARNSTYTSQVLNELYEKSLQIERADQGLSILSQSIETAFNQYLADNGYGELSAENVIGNSQAQSQAIDLTRKRLERDIIAFGQNLEDIKKEIHTMDARKSAIYGNAKNERRMLSPSEQFEVDTLDNLRQQLLTLGSSQLQSLYAIVDNANAIMYQNSELLNTEGNPIINAASPRFLRTINTTFGSYVSSDGDIVNSLLQSIPVVGGLFSSSSVEQPTPPTYSRGRFAYDPKARH